VKKEIVVNYGACWSFILGTGNAKGTTKRRIHARSFGTKTQGILNFGSIDEDYLGIKRGIKKTTI
jgi:hypothetical protein